MLGSGVRYPLLGQEDILDASIEASSLGLSINKIDRGPFPGYRSPLTWSETRADFQTKIEKESLDNDLVSQLLEKGRNVWRHDMRNLLVDSIELGDHEIAVEYMESDR